MALSRRHLITLSAGAGAAALIARNLAPGATPAAAAEGNYPAPPPEVVALTRMAYGPTPDELARVQNIGLTAYIAEQLHPTLVETPAVAQRLATATFPINVPVRDEPEIMMMMDDSDVDGSMDQMQQMDQMDEMTPRQRQQQRQQNQQQQQINRPERERRELGMDYINAPLKERWGLVQNYQQGDQPLLRRPATEVGIATWLRAAHSPFQLQEVLAEFWHNHFNVDVSANRNIGVVWPDYDRLIRTHTLGNFREFVEAVGSSPAMLYYLNNAASKASPANENYARELFELHTLGESNYFNAAYQRWDEVPGARDGKPIGYIDEDVYEAARAFTGWTVADAGRMGRRNGGRNQGIPNTGEFYYHDAWHDPYQKRVMGTEFDPNQPALADGKQVYDIVAFHPGTAQFVCTKLCRRLIADNPPQDVVDAAVATWMAKQNDPHQLRHVVETILTHKRFTTGWGAKVKTPYEMAISFFRGTGAELTPSPQAFRMMQGLGYLQFTYPAPTGHPDTAAYWLSTNGLLGRWNLLQFAQAERGGIARIDWGAQMPAEKTAEASVDFWSTRLLHVPLGAPAKAAIIEALGQQPLNPQRHGFAAALIAMTPEFQRR